MATLAATVISDEHQVATDVVDVIKATDAIAELVEPFIPPCAQPEVSIAIAVDEGIAVMIEKTDDIIQADAPRIETAAQKVDDAVMHILTPQAEGSPTDALNAAQKRAIDAQTKSSIVLNPAPKTSKSCRCCIL